VFEFKLFEIQDKRLVKEPDLSSLVDFPIVITYKEIITLNIELFW